MHFRTRLLALLALAGCAQAARPPDQAGSRARPRAGVPDAFRGLVSDAVLVLPLYGFSVDDTTGLSAAAADTIIAAFETALRDSSAGVVSDSWVWPSRIRSLHRRNPLAIPDPAKLALDEVLERRQRPPVTLPQDVAADIRRLLAVSGARRYVVLPFWLGISRRQPGSVEIILTEGTFGPGRLWVQVGVAVIDARLAEIVRVVTVASGPRVTAQEAALAAAGAFRSLFGERGTR